MERKAYRELLKWKENPHHKPLILNGARQVGKTWLLKWGGGFVIVTFKRPKYDLSTTQVRLKYVPTTAQVQRLVKLMGDEYMGMKEIMELFDLKSIKRFRENYIQPALSEGAIERLYPDLPNHPKQKYHLTNSAKEWKKKNMHLK